MVSNAGRSSSPMLGEATQPSLLIPVHLRARKARGFAGVSNKQLYCVCPAGVRAREACHGNGPSASEERSETWPQRPCPAPLFFADRRKATSLEPPSGLLCHLPKASRP